MRRQPSYPAGTVDRWGRKVDDNPAFWAEMGPFGNVRYTLKRAFNECGHEIHENCGCYQDLYDYLEDFEEKYKYLLIAS